MSGPRRLAVFLTGLWVLGWATAYAIDTQPFRFDGFLLFGVVPPTIPWGLWWVWRGFSPRS